MSKHWGIVIVLGVTAAASAFLGCGKRGDESTANARGAVAPGKAGGGETADALDDGRCSQGEGCAVACVYPADGCDPSDPNCQGYCLRGNECVADSTCDGGQRCLECISIGDSVSCTEICNAIVIVGNDGGVGGEGGAGGDTGGQSGEGGAGGADQGSQGPDQGGTSSSSGGSSTGHPPCNGGSSNGGQGGDNGGGQGGTGGSGAEIENPK